MVFPLLAAVAPYAPLIGGALGAIGSLFAPKPKAVAGSIDLQGLRRDAEAAGFNPLAIIRGGGLAGYGVTPAAPDTRLSNAFAAFGSGVANWNFDPYGEAKSLSELALARAQIASYGKSSAPSGLSFQTPKSSGTWAGAAPDRHLRVDGWDWGVDGGWSPANDWENEYGDFGQLIYGAVHMGADTLNNVGFKGDKLMADFGNGVVDFVKYIGDRRTAIEKKRTGTVGVDGVFRYTGGGF